MLLHDLLIAAALAAAVAAPQQPPADAGKPARPRPAATQPAQAGTPAAAPPKAAPPSGASAAPMDPAVKQLVDRMQGFYEKTQDFRARFRQDYRYQTFKRTQTSTGQVTFKKPALMRWDYQTPSPKTFVLAKDKIYAHDPGAQTLTVAKVDTSQLSASVTFLFGQGKLADEFAIKKGECKDCTGTLLVLDPLKPDPRFRQLRLEVDPKTAQVLKSTVVDPDGSENAITFLDLKSNVGVDAAAFAINPPEGTHVEDLTRPRPTK